MLPRRVAYVVHAVKHDELLQESIQMGAAGAIFEVHAYQYIRPVPVLQKHMGQSQARESAQLH